MNDIDISALLPSMDNFVYLYELLAFPISTYYMIAALSYMAMGALECIIIKHTKFISSATVMTYLIGTIVAFNQVILNQHSECQDTAISYVFGAICLANLLYLFVCTVFTKDSYMLVLAHVSLLFYFVYIYAIHNEANKLLNVADFMAALQMCATMVQNVIPLESIIASLCKNSNRTPTHWLALYIGLTYCLTGGLYRHQNGETVMGSVDALGISVHLFGLAVAIYHSLCL
ncbi:unnamed protein product [Hydatigera taeniaeformis]|uniref:Transmembrane protein n=1 Tax=Hydatigena taeniaeformis TaxID=6205 RepID=A0A0R3WS73_HYDTA|nr:unnamed protein product [Hydatigera taeniaeformis]